MNLLRWWRSWRHQWCAHPHTYRERRKRHGSLVQHLVCDRCGHARPTVDRTAKEHRRTVAIGEASSARVIARSRKKVVGINRAR